MKLNLIVEPKKLIEHQIHCNKKRLIMRRRRMNRIPHCYVLDLRLAFKSFVVIIFFAEGGIIPCRIAYQKYL